jgi:hypothetical protein
MTEQRAIKATYSDWRTVKSRKVLQIVFEVPLEQQDDVLKMLGAPMPGEEKWVAIAMLAQTLTIDAKPSQPKRWVEMSRPQQAGILCSDPRFQGWVLDQPEGPEDPAAFVRWFCNVRSRADLDTVPTAFDDLVTTYRRDTGQMAEKRA